jgi:hypothetical protein
VRFVETPIAGIVRCVGIERVVVETLLAPATEVLGPADRVTRELSSTARVAAQRTTLGRNLSNGDSNKVTA